MRVAFFAVLFANLAFLAWARWIDAPRQVPPADPLARLPRLTLAGEVQRTGEVPPEPAAQARPGVTETAARLPSAPAPSPALCISVGPFPDLTRAARAAALLRERGFNPQQRAEEGERLEGYWVFVGGLQSAAEEAQVLRTLERNGIRDAHAMPASAEGRRVSVGVFSERGRAERRARAVQRLGLQPQIRERRQAGTVYWVDLDLGTSESAVPTDELVSLESPDARLEIRACQSGETDMSSPSPEQTLPELPPAPTTTADAGPPRPV